MQNYVTAETALKLKDAGFPQPAQEYYQIWYMAVKDARPRIVIEFTDASVEFDWYDEFPLKVIAEHYAFAPTATDILRELGSDYAISFLNGRFYCERRYFGVVYDHENAAEAAALAFFDSKIDTP